MKPLANQNKTEIIFFLGFFPPSVSLSSFLFFSSFHCLSSFCALLLEWKIVTSWSVHLSIARSRHFSDSLIVFPFFLLAIRLYFRFTMLQIIFHLEHASCLLSAFAFVQNIYHLETVCLYFQLSLSPALFLLTNTHSFAASRSMYTRNECHLWIKSYL